MKRRISEDSTKPSNIATNPSLYQENDQVNPVKAITNKNMDA